MDSKDFFDFMTIAFGDFLDDCVRRTKILQAPGIHNHDDADNMSAMTLDEISQFRKRSPHGCHIIDQNMNCARGHQTFEIGTGGDAFHGIRACMEYPADLHNIIVSFATCNHRTRLSQNLGNCIVASCFTGVRCDVTCSGWQAMSVCQKKWQRKIRYKAHSGRHLACFGGCIRRM